MTVNDIVLIYVDNKPGFYARIDEISPDVKPGWWQVQLLVFTFPLQAFNWILDEYQLEGADFTMSGTPIRLEPVISPIHEERRVKEEENEAPRKEQLDRLRQVSTGSKVVSLADRRKK